jgi:DNA polymerase III alpha subunit
MPFAELSVTSNFTFLTGASHPEEMMRRAADLGLPALAIADENSVAGIVRAHVEAREIARRGGSAPRLIPAARIVTRDGLTVTLLPRDRAAWGRLCRLLTDGRRRAPKGDCDLFAEDLIHRGAGQEMLLHPAARDRAAGDWAALAQRLINRFPGQVSLLLAPRYDGQDRARFDRLARLADRLGIPTVASALPMMHHGARRRLADVLTAIRLGCRVDALGRRALANAETRLRSEAEMLRLFAGHEPAVQRSGEIAARLTFTLDALRYDYPSETADGAIRRARRTRCGRR